MTRARLARLLPVLFALVVGLLVVPLGARAAEIPGAITGISTNARDVGQYQEVRFDCTWAVPDGASVGDTLALDLPPELRWYGATDFDLRAADGAVVARARASADGRVVFTLTDYVETHHDVHGSCSFATQYYAPTTGNTVDLEFGTGGEVIRVPVTTAPPCARCEEQVGDQAVKRMWWYDNTQSSTQSVLLAPAAPTDGTTVTITDAPGAGIALDCASVQAKLGAEHGANGYLTDPLDTANRPVITCTAQSVSVTWTGVAAGRYAELWVRATVTDPSAASYANSGKVVLNGQGQPVDAVVRRSSSTGTGNGTTQTPTPTPTETPTGTPTAGPTPSPGTSPTVTPTAGPTEGPGTGVVSPPVGPGALPETGAGGGLVWFAGAAALLLGLGAVVLAGSRRS